MKIQVILRHDENDNLPCRDICPPNPEREGAIEVEVLMPDGRKVTAIARPAAGVLQNVVKVSRGGEMDSEKDFEVWRGFVSASPGEGDIIEPLYESDSEEEALAFARGYAAENFLPIVTWLKGCDRHLWSPIEILVEDGRGGMRICWPVESSAQSLDRSTLCLESDWMKPCRWMRSSMPLVLRGRFPVG